MGAPVAEVTAVFAPRNTSAVVDVEDRIAVAPGGISQIFTPALPEVGAVTCDIDKLT
jgi:hypothetical protein